MESNWAAEHLQVIRTLMERSAVYRRALAPVMIYNGAMGLLGGIASAAFGIEAPRGFVGYWAGVGLLALAGSFLLVRRQALKDSEPFWSPPTRRVAQALLPPFFVGSFAGFLLLTRPAGSFLEVPDLPGLWMVLYGCALAAAGFFMQRGIKVLGWLFILAGCGLMAVERQPLSAAHWAMGGVFGGLHLAYGVYLYFTEPRRNET